MDNFGAGFFLGAVFMFVIAGIAMLGVTRDANTRWHNEIISRGYAQYCPNNGEWAWKGECE